MDDTVGGLGEFGLIDAVTARLRQGPDVLVGPGDDAAVVAARDGRVVATTDLLVEGRHFRSDWSSAADVGHKAAAQNLADIAAMGAIPTVLLVGLATPADLSAEWALGLADGLREECARVGASVAGGDIVRADTVMIAVTALGDLRGRAPVTRSGARPGDVVAVCGRLGWSAAGYAVLSAGGFTPSHIVAAHLRPHPPYDAGPDAAAYGATAMIDVSDGLLADLGHIAAASGVAIDLDSSALTPDQPLQALGTDLGVDALSWVLRGGEDHALAACFPAGAALPVGWRVVGRAGDGAGVTVDGSPYAGPPGFDHFR